MSKTIFRPFWSFDVIKTEKWLSAMHAKGYALQKVHFTSRLFVFEEAEPVQMFYRIIFDKYANGAPEIYLQESAYEQVFFSKNFYLLRTEQTDPAMNPSYDGFLKRNKAIYMKFGYLLLFLIVVYLPLLMLSTFVLFSYSFSSLYDALQFIGEFSILWLTAISTVLIFLKLRKTNRELEKL
jgi:hypothetical protein